MIVSFSLRCRLNSSLTLNLFRFFRTALFSQKKLTIFKWKICGKFLYCLLWFKGKRFAQQILNRIQENEQLTELAISTCTFEWRAILEIASCNQTRYCFNNSWCFSAVHILFKDLRITLNRCILRSSGN